MACNIRQNIIQTAVERNLITAKLTIIDNEGLAQYNDNNDSVAREKYGVTAEGKPFIFTNLGTVELNEPYLTELQSVFSNTDLEITYDEAISQARNKILDDVRRFLPLSDFIKSFDGGKIQLNTYSVKNPHLLNKAVNKFKNKYPDVKIIIDSFEKELKFAVPQSVFNQFFNNASIIKKDVEVKQGVPELFESNPELANAVYEALEFKSKPDVILPIGTSGSGKSTFIKSLPQENLVVIEPDAMRVEFTGDINDKSKDKEIYVEAANRAIQAIKQGKQVVFDTTNLTKDKRLPFIEAIKKAIPNANIQYKLMELNPELAKQRIKAQLERGENRAAVSDETIDRHAASYKQMLEDIKSEPISNFELTPQQKQQAQQQYSQYLDTIFLDSKVKDIVYRGGNLGTKQPQDVEAFTTNKSYAEYRAEQNNTKVFPAILNIKESKLLDKKETRTLSLDRDEFQYQDYGFTDNKDQTKQLGNFYTVKETNRYILGTKQDIEGFKEFVSPSNITDPKLNILINKGFLDTEC